MNLFLVRHGAYNDANVDPDKGLSDEGREQSQKIADFLAKKGLQPGEIWHSDKTRAIQTAEILGDKLTVPTSEKNFLAPNDAIKTALVETELIDHDLMVVGHLPFLSNLAAFLTAGQESPELIDFPEAGVLLLSKPKDDWQIEWFISPELL